MARNQGRNLIREQIAHLAARLMAEDGIEDYALAKRKAARQAGAPDSRNLPNNDEIDAALRVHQQLYQQTSHEETLRGLRWQAADVMRLLEPFRPHLTGSVLSGVAGRFAGISVHLFAESAKDVEIFLINRGIPFRVGDARYFAGDEPRNVPRLTLDQDGTEIRLSIFAPRDQRSVLRATPGGRPIERAKLETVEAMLA